MAEPKVYEGTWEEIASHADEFRNYPNLTLIVPAAAGNGIADTNRNLAEALKDYVGSAHFGEANLSENTGKKFARLLTEKYRKEQARPRVRL